MPLAKGRDRCCRRNRPASRIPLLHPTEVSNLGGIPRFANFPPAVAGGSSAPSDSGDERASSRRKTTAAVNLAVTLAQLGDRTLLDRFGHAQARHPPRIEYHYRQGSRAKFISRRRVHTRGSHNSSSHNRESRRPDHGPDSPSPADLLSSHRMREAITEFGTNSNSS